MNQWVATWAVCQVGTHHELPSFFNTTPSLRGHLWWVGLRDILEALVRRCHPHPPLADVDMEDQLITDFLIYKSGQGLPPHPSMPTLHTKCVVPPRGHGWVHHESLQGRYKMQPHPGGGRDGQSRAYIKVKKFMFDNENNKEFYLHNLLCYMYNGPSPAPDLVVGHLCGNKLCILPWHMAWISQSLNVEMGWAKKKRKWRA